MAYGISGEEITKIKNKIASKATSVAGKIYHAVEKVAKKFNSGPTRPGRAMYRGNAPAFRDRTLRSPRGAGAGGEHDPAVYKAAMEGTRRGNAESGRGVGY